jgi:hypothetical protein
MHRAYYTYGRKHIMIVTINVDLLQWKGGNRPLLTHDNGSHQASSRVRPATSARQAELGCGSGVTLFHSHEDVWPSFEKKI